MSLVRLPLLALFALAACAPGAEDSGGKAGDDTADTETGGDTADTSDTDDTTAVDGDLDGYAEGEDCNDADPAVNPGAAEVCNAIDDDCDGSTDQQPTDGSTYYLDGDGDGFGDDATAVEACAQPTDTVTVGGDCDDTSDVVYPGSTYVICDGADNDCDAGTPDTESGTWWQSDDGSWLDFTSTLAGGTASAPVAATLNSGTLHVCDGTWYVNLTVTGTVAILGHGTGDAPELDGGRRSSVIAASADGTTLLVDGLTLRNGAGTGSSGNTTGGAIYAVGTGACAVTVRDSTIELSTAYLGGGIYVENCDLSVSRGTILDNTANYGGGVHAYVHGVEVALDFEESLVQGNTATYGAGGGISIEAYSTPTALTLVDTLVQQNTAYRGGGLALSGDTAVGSCTGTGAGTAGFHGNSAQEPDGSVFKGAGAVMVDLAVFDASNCDFGEPETLDNNTPDDIKIPGYGDPDVSFDYGDGATFSCDADGCR